MADKNFVIKNGLVVGDTLTIAGVELDLSNATSGQVLKFDGSKFAAATDSTIDEPSSYSTTIGDGSSSSYVLTHNLNTRDVVVSVLDATGLYDVINVRSEATSANTVTLDFSSAVSLNSRDVLIVSAGDLDYYSSTIGDGSNSSIVLNHNLGSRDVVVTVRNASSPYEFVDVATFGTSPNKITLDFSTAPEANSLVAAVYLPLEGYSYSEIVGDGSTSVFTLNHNLNTKNVNLIVRETDSPYRIVKTYWEATTENAVSVALESIPSANSIQVTVFAGLGGKVSIPSFTQIYDKSFEYKVGDTGPGGGTIFYVDSYNEWPDFTYLELSPNSAQATKKFFDPGTSYATYNSYSIPGAGLRKLGGGYQNTLDIIDTGLASTTSSAAGYCHQLVLNGKSDWYLPSEGEYKRIYNDLYMERELGNINPGTPEATLFYWTSTEGSVFSFYTGLVSSATSRVNSNYQTRPIRRFS